MKALGFQFVHGPQFGLWKVPLLVFQRCAHIQQIGNSAVNVIHGEAAKALVLARSESALRLYEQYGDAAINAIVLHGKSAEFVLEKAGSAAMAQQLCHCDAEQMRQLFSLVQNGAITPQNSAAWLAYIQDGGKSALTLAAGHPSLFSAGSFGCSLVDHCGEGGAEPSPLPASASCAIRRSTP